MTDKREQVAELLKQEYDGVLCRKRIINLSGEQVAKFAEAVDKIYHPEPAGDLREKIEALAKQYFTQIDNMPDDAWERLSVRAKQEILEKCSKILALIETKPDETEAKAVDCKNECTNYDKCYPMVNPIMCSLKDRKPKRPPCHVCGGTGEKVIAGDTKQAAIEDCPNCNGSGVEPEKPEGLKLERISDEQIDAIISPPNTKYARAYEVANAQLSHDQAAHNAAMGELRKEIAELKAANDRQSDSLELSVDHNKDLESQLAALKAEIVKLKQNIKDFVCSRCGKSIAGISDDGLLIVRAFVECEDCVKKQPDYEFQLAEKDKYIRTLEATIKGEAGLIADIGNRDKQLSALKAENEKLNKDIERLEKLGFN